MPPNVVIPPLHKIYSVELTKADSSDFTSSSALLYLKLSGETFILTLQKENKKMKALSGVLENLFANKFKDDPHCKVSRSDLDRISRS